MFNLTNTDNDTIVSLMSPVGYIASAIAIFIIGFLGFFFNLFIIILISSNKQLWTPVNVIIFNLVLSDFFVSFLGIPWTFIAAVNRQWIFGKTICTLYGFLMAFLGFTSIATLTVLAFERYVIVSQPFRNRNLTYTESLILVIGIWIYSFSLTLPPLFGWGQYVNEAANISCSVNWEEKSFNSMTFILFIFIFGLFLPLIIIIFSYVNIIITMKKKTYKIGQVSKAEKKVSFMIFLMILAFLLAWSPYAILALTIQFGDASFITPAMAVFPSLLAKSSICYNPIIYVGLNPQFRKSWRQSKYTKEPYSTYESTTMKEFTVVSKDNSESKKKCKNDKCMIFTINSQSTSFSPDEQLHTSNITTPV